MLYRVDGGGGDVNVSEEEENSVINSSLVTKLSI